MKKTVSIFLTLLLLLSLCACGSKDKDAPASAPAASTSEPASAPAPTPAPAPADTAEGTYKLTDIISDGQSQFEELASLGLTYYLILEQGGTGYIEMFGEKIPVSWTDTKLTDSEGLDAAFTYANGTVTVDTEDGSAVFTRLTEEELAYFQEHGSGSLEDVFGSLGEGETFENSGDIGDFHAAFLGAEGIQNDDGEPAIRIWYEVTNNSLIVCPSPLWLTVTQGDADLDMTYLYEDVPESGYSNLALAPGRTIRCAALYNYDPQGDIITASLSEFFGDSVVSTFDPTALPGAPTDTFAIEPDPTAAEFMRSVPQTGEGVEILGVEKDVDWNDEPVVVVRLRFTNTGDEANSFFSMFNVYALQDGYGLEMGSVLSDDAAISENPYADVEPGESIECAYVFELRGESPVAVVFQGSLGSSCFGQVFTLD